MGKIKLNCLTEDTSYLLKIKTMSERFSLNKEDILKVLKNAGIFLAPALLIFLVQIQAGVSIKESLYAVYLWLLNTVIDLLRKFIASK